MECLYADLENKKHLIINREGDIFKITLNSYFSEQLLSSNQDYYFVLNEMLKLKILAQFAFPIVMGWNAMDNPNLVYNDVKFF